MRKLFLAAGVAALAIAAPAVAKPDRDDKDRGAKAAKVDRGGGNARGARAEKRGGGEARTNRNAERSAARAQQRGGGEAQAQRRPGQEMRLATMQARGNSEARARGNSEARSRGNANARVADDRRVDNSNRAQNNKSVQARLRDRDRDDERVRVRDGDRIRTVERNGRVRLGDWDGGDRWTRGRALGLIDGCPPGLAKKNNGCMPPGLAKQLVGSVIPAAYASQALPSELRYLYQDTDDYYFRYGDGYAYRVDRGSNLVRSVLPLIGAALGIGQPFPYNSSAFNMPSYYQPFYPATDRYEYRYANGYVYEIDRYTGMISNVIPHYDHGYGIGQMLPASYSYYNVPDPYRQWYADDDDYYYRYAPGAIYRVDQGSNLITAIVSLLAGGFGIGQPLPMGYGAYNVPMTYRDQYYDTPDAWYRYGNGNIYQVDPTTRLITAIVQAIV